MSKKRHIKTNKFTKNNFEWDQQQQGQTIDKDPAKSLRSKISKEIRYMTAREKK